LVESELRSVKKELNSNKNTVMARRKKHRGAATHHRKRRRRMNGPYLTGPYLTGHKRRRSGGKRRRSMLGGYKWESLFSDTFTALAAGFAIGAVTKYMKKRTEYAHDHVSRAAAKGVLAVVISPLFGYTRMTDIIAISLMSSAGNDLEEKFGSLRGIAPGGMGRGEENKLEQENQELKRMLEMNGIAPGGMGLPAGDEEYALTGDDPGMGDNPMFS
jgi:hypothetical protein